MALATEPKPWEPGSFSSPQRFHAFSHLRDLPPAERSTVRALNEHRKTCLGKATASTVNGRWKLWSVEDDWVGRLELWDAEVDRQRRERFLKTQLDAVERHQRLTTAALNVATVPIRAVLNRLTDPAFLKSVESAPSWALLRDTLRSIQVLPTLINAERQALGLHTMEVAVEDRRFERTLADRITADPVATGIAVDLLHQLARPVGEPSP
jgi:hypothetical protein